MNRRSPLALLGIACMVLVTACSAPPASTPMPTPEPMSEAPSGGATSDAAPSEAPTGEATSSPSPEASEAPAEALLAVELTDVRSGDTFTLGELAADHGPVLLEPMAVWCTSCLAQQREVVHAHEAGDFTSVSLDVDLSEDAEDLAAYAAREGFAWRFAMADAALYRLLQERFNPAATNPPSTPLIIIEGDGTVRFLEPGIGIRSAEQLLDELGAG